MLPPLLVLHISFVISSVWLMLRVKTRKSHVHTERHALSIVAATSMMMVMVDGMHVVAALLMLNLHLNSLWMAAVINYRATE